MRLFIADLDNAIYDWVTYYAQAFRAMVTSLVNITEIAENVLLDDFRSIHHKYANFEYPFAVLELSSLRAKYSR